MQKIIIGPKIIESIINCQIKNFIKDISFMFLLSPQEFVHEQPSGLSGIFTTRPELWLSTVEDLSVGIRNNQIGV